MKFYLVSSALVLFITAPGIAAANKQRRRLRGSHVTDYSNYDEAIANAEDDEGRTSYGYNNYYNPGPGREVARESGYTFGHDGLPEAASFAALAGEWTCDTRVCCGDETWAKCGLPGGASCNVSCNGYNNDGGAPLGSDPATWGPRTNNMPGSNSATWGPPPGSRYGPNSYKNNEGYKHRANYGSDPATWAPPSRGNSFCHKFGFDHHRCNNYPEQCSFDGRHGCVQAY